MHIEVMFEFRRPYYNVSFQLCDAQVAFGGIFSLCDHFTATAHKTNNPETNNTRDPKCRPHGPSENYQRFRETNASQD